MVAALAVALVLSRIRASLAAGLLLGFGLLSAAGSLGLRNFFSETLSDSFVPLGALAILPAGLLCAWLPDDDRGGRLDRVVMWLAAAGAVLCLVTVFPLSRAYDGGDFEYAVELYVAGAAIVVAVLVLARFSRPVFAAGIMLSLGAQTALHSIALIRIQPTAGHSGLLISGICAALGAALIVAAGLSVLRAERARSPRPSPA